MRLQRIILSGLSCLYILCFLLSTLWQTKSYACERSLCNSTQPLAMVLAETYYETSAPLCGMVLSDTITESLEPIFGLVMQNTSTESFSIDQCIYSVTDIKSGFYDYTVNKATTSYIVNLLYYLLYIPKYNVQNLARNSRLKIERHYIRRHQFKIYLKRYQIYTFFEIEDFKPQRFFFIVCFQDRFIRTYLQVFGGGANKEKKEKKKSKKKEEPKKRTWTGKELNEYKLSSMAPLNDDDEYRIAAYIDKQDRHLFEKLVILPIPVSILVKRGSKDFLADVALSHKVISNK